MGKHSNTPRKEQRQVRSHATQLQTIFEYLQSHVATASMVSSATGIYQKNICRYKRDLEKTGRLKEVRKGTCEITGFEAWFITCDPKQFPPPSQLSFFE
jgi:hypothetical protein